jgi:hypothetical protein
MEVKTRMLQGDKAKEKDTGYEVSGKGVEPNCNENDVKSCRNHIMSQDKEGNKKTRVSKLNKV